MASSSSLAIMKSIFVVSLFVGFSYAQLSTDFYSHSCPGLFSTVKSVVLAAISKETRMGASLLRLFFHDCVVNGCDGSVLLDDTPHFTGEKRAGPNLNSARGFNVVDDIKSAIEKVCPGVVSCADIVAISARDSIEILGGPCWDVKLGRRDALTASQAAANASIPRPSSSLATIITTLSRAGLNAQDVVALSGAHTIGLARCTNYRSRIYNETKSLDSYFATKLRHGCPKATGSGDNNLAPLDQWSPMVFDNKYYENLMNRMGLLHSDQQLFSGGSTDSLVREYGANPSRFYADFVASMIKMGDIKPLTGTKGEIRKNCRKWN